MSNFYDEQESNDEFVRKLGRQRADRLQNIWDNSYPKSGPYGYSKQVSKSEVFKKDAKNQGYKNSEIEMFMRL